MSQKLTDKTAKENPDAKIAAETVLIDNATTRISEIVFQSDEQTGWHLHDWDYVTVQQSGGCLEIAAVDGTVRMMDYKPGVTNYRKAPIEHIARNISGVEVRVLEIEYKKS